MIINFKTDIIMRKLLLIRWCALLVCHGSAYVRGLTNNWLKCGGRTQDDPGIAAEDSGLRLSIQPASK